MATSITNGYTDLSTYKLRFFDGETDDHKDDDNLNLVITATSRAIDNICHRRFYAVTETRKINAVRNKRTFFMPCPFSM